MERKKPGRPKKGETRKISITLPLDDWVIVDEQRASGATYIEAIVTLLQKIKDEN